MPVGQYVMEVNLLADGSPIWGPFLLDGQVGAGHAAKVFVSEGGRFNIVIGDVDTASRKLSTALALPEGTEVKIQYTVEGLQQPLAQLVQSVPYAHQVTSIAGMKANDQGLYSIGTSQFDGKLLVDGTLMADDMNVISGLLTARELVESKNLNVQSVNTKDMEFGRILHFKLQDVPYPEGGSQFDRELNVYVSNYFCGLTRFDTESYPDDSGPFGGEDGGDAHCRLYVDVFGEWHLEYGLGGGMTRRTCRATCFQYQP